MSLLRCSRTFNCTKNCPNFQPEIDSMPERGGMCRKNPPIPVILGQSPSGQLMVKGIFPMVSAVDWCAEHPAEQARRNRESRARAFALPDIWTGGKVTDAGSFCEQPPERPSAVLVEAKPPEAPRTFEHVELRGGETADESKSPHENKEHKLQ